MNAKQSSSGLSRGKGKGTGKLCIYLLTFTLAATWDRAYSHRPLMPRSKYKYVTWRSRAGKPWQALVQGKYLGSFAKEEEAVEAVAKKLRQPKASLLRSHHGSAPMRTPRRTHRYVYWHRLDQLWHLRIGHTFLGSFADPEVA